MHFQTFYASQDGTASGFSISFGVDGLNTKVGGGRRGCHRQEPLGGLNFKI